MSHTAGPWKLEVVESLSVYGPEGLELATLHGHHKTKANAMLIAAAPELLEELEKAHRIICNALNSMTEEQKNKWNELNERYDLKDGWALTRANIRESLIKKAKNES